MSTHSRSPSFGVTLDSNFTGDHWAPSSTITYRDYDYNWSSSELSTTMAEHLPCVTQHPFPEDTHSFSDPRQEDLDYTPDADASTIVNAQIPDIRLDYDPSPTPTTVGGRQSRTTTSASYPDYGQVQNGGHLGDHMAFNPYWTQWTDLYPNRQPLLRSVGQGTRDISDQFLRGLNEMSPFARSLHDTLAPYPIHSNTSEPSIPHLVAQSSPPQPVTPSSSHPGSHSNSPIPYLQGSTGSARQRRSACAIEHDGLWIDRAELLQGLMEHEGNMSVHQCHWEEDQSPCCLWIKGNKSCVNTHIQKWHGGKPGGEKRKTKCRWPGCGMTMLKESISRHIVNIHLGELWECQGCGKSIARNDAYGQHAMRSKFEACKTSGALIMYLTDARAVNARAALDGGGRRRYAGTEI